MATERGTQHKTNNHLFILVLSWYTPVDDSSPQLATDTKLILVIACDITAVRRTDCRINHIKKQDNNSE